MGASYHKMVNMLTHRMSIVFNPLIYNTNHNYQQLAYQMGQTADFFGVSQAHVQSVPNNQILQHAILSRRQHMPKWH